VGGGCVDSQFGKRAEGFDFRGFAGLFFARDDVGKGVKIVVFFRRGYG
jgi:hypothetical protein